MENWRDWASVIGYSFAIAASVATVAWLFVFTLFRIARLIRTTKSQRTLRMDFIRIWPVGAVVTALIFIPGVLLGYWTSDMCGTDEVSDIISPDHQHKIVVYNFDCGATTAFSLNVSLLRADQFLFKHKRSLILYSHPGKFPGTNDFAVTWSDATHVTIWVSPFEEQPKTVNQDGVTVRIDDLTRRR